MYGDSNYSSFYLNNYSYGGYDDVYGNYDIDPNYGYFGNGSDSGNDSCIQMLDLIYQEDENFSPTKLFSGEIFTATMYVVLAMIGLIGNGLVLFVIFGGKETTKTVANIYIWNLALADLLFVCTLPFMAAQLFLLRWPFGDFMCKVVEAIKHHNYYSSVCFLTAMSIDRYFAVVHVVNSVKYRTARMTAFVCSAIWILSFSMTIPLVMNIILDDTGKCSLNFIQPSNWEKIDVEKQDTSSIFNHYKTDPDTLSPEDCQKLLQSHFVYYKVDENEFKNETVPDTANDPLNSCEQTSNGLYRAYIWFSFACGFCVPFIVIVICYTLIIMKILKPSELKVRSTQAERKRRKVTRMVIAMVSCFFICWLPYHVFHLLKLRGITLYANYCDLIAGVTYILAFTNSCINPILYTFLGHNFKDRLRRSMTITLRSLSLSTFTKYTSNNNTTSRGGDSNHHRNRRSEQLDNKKSSSKKSNKGYDQSKRLLSVSSTK